MTKRRTTKRFQPRTKFHLIYLLLALAIGLSLHSCADIPTGRELVQCLDRGQAVEDQAALQHNSLVQCVGQQL